MLNLARNGIEAMAQTPSRQRRLSIQVAAEEEQVVVSVADHGPGLAPDIVTNLF